MKYKEDLVKICGMLHRFGLVSGSDGNISIRLDDSRILATPSKVNKAFITEDSLLTVGFDGRLYSGEGQITSELAMHTRIYRLREDVTAVIHTHAPFSSAFGICEMTVPDNLLIEIPAIIGRIGLADFAIPGTSDMADVIESHIITSNAVILKNHGVITIGTDIFEAYDRLESLENAAKSIILSKLLGSASEIDRQAVDKMYERTRIQS